MMNRRDAMKAAATAVLAGSTGLPNVCGGLPAKGTEWQFGNDATPMRVHYWATRCLDPSLVGRAWCLPASVVTLNDGHVVNVRFV